MVISCPFQGLGCSQTFPRAEYVQHMVNFAVHHDKIVAQTEIKSMKDQIAIQQVQIADLMEFVNE